MPPSYCPFLRLQFLQSKQSLEIVSLCLNLKVLVFCQHTRGKIKLQERHLVTPGPQSAVQFGHMSPPRGQLLLFLEVGWRQLVWRVSELENMNWLPGRQGSSCQHKMCTALQPLEQGTFLCFQICLLPQPNLPVSTHQPVVMVSRVNKAA